MGANGIAHGSARDAEPVLGEIDLSLDPVAPSVAKARRAVDALFAEAQPSDEFRYSVRLVVTELVSNAIAHGSTSHPVNLNLTLYSGGVHVRIHNLGSPPESKNLHGDRSEGGRGLQIVARLSETWSIEHGGTGTTADARVPARPVRP